LLAAAGKTIDVGHVNLEPYLFDQEVYGAYDRHWNRQSTSHISSYLTSMVITAGIFENVDLIFVPRGEHTHTKNKSRTALGDTTVGFGYQLVRSDEDSWRPDIRLIFEETLPSGKFKELSPDDGGADSTGGGAYVTTVGLCAQKVLVLSNRHPLRLRFNATISRSTFVHVRDTSSYGGGIGTRGTVCPGNVFGLILAGEYSITQNWVAAIDISYTHSGKTTFSGNPGVTPSGAIATVGGPSNDQISIAPAIEYNFNKTVGIVGGVWFTVAGRNSSAFVTPSIAVNIYF
jgi:hypothetical protein